MQDDQINYGELSYRARVRDRYVLLFRRSGILERMALADYNFPAYTKGRIEVVEEIALGVLDSPSNFIMNLEEQHYAAWLQEVVNGESGGILFRDQFFYGMPDETPLFLQGEITETDILSVR